MIVHKIQTNSHTAIQHCNTKLISAKTQPKEDQKEENLLFCDIIERKGSCQVKKQKQNKNK